VDYECSLGAERLKAFFSVEILGYFMPASHKTEAVSHLSLAPAYRVIDFKKSVIKIFFSD